MESRDSASAGGKGDVVMGIEPGQSFDVETATTVKISDLLTKHNCPQLWTQLRIHLTIYIETQRWTIQIWGASELWVPGSLTCAILQ